MVGCPDSLGAIGAHDLVVAVVEQDYIAAVDLFCDLAFDYGCRRGVPIVAGYVPHDGLEAQLARNAENGRAACAKRWAEEIRLAIERGAQGGVAGNEFLANFA